MGFKRAGQGKIGEVNGRIREKWREKERPLERKWLHRNETYDFCVRHSNYCAPITIFMKRAFVPTFQVMKYLSVFRDPRKRRTLQSVPLWANAPRSIFRYTLRTFEKEKRKKKEGEEEEKCDRKVAIKRRRYFSIFANHKLKV